MFIQQDGLKNLNTVKSNLLLTFIAILLLNKHLKLSSLISTDSVIDHFSEERRKKLTNFTLNPPKYNKY